MCDRCEHKPVCGKFLATGGVKECEHHKAERRGHWITDSNGVIICSECGEEHEWIDYRASFCEHCGADMRGTENG